MTRRRAIRILFWQHGREGWRRFHFEHLGWYGCPGYPMEMP